MSFYQHVWFLTMTGVSSCVDGHIDDALVSSWRPWGRFPAQPVNTGVNTQAPGDTFLKELLRPRSQEAQGYTLSITRGPGVGRCPVQRLQAWLLLHVG